MLSFVWITGLRILELDYDQGGFHFLEGIQPLPQYLVYNLMAPAP